jgi:signal peptidase I
MTKSLNEDKNLKNNIPQEEENFWVETIKTLAMAIVLSFGIRVFVAEARYIPSSSMEPTLQIDDKLIIEKMTYRFKEPQRGDIVVFSPTEELQNQGYKEDFIKRIIGLPDDKVKVTNGKVYINDKEIQEGYIMEDPDYDYGPTIVPEGKYLVLGDNRNNSLDSHYWGFVPKENLIGRAFVRFWPLGFLDKHTNERNGFIFKQPVYEK